MPYMPEWLNDSAAAVRVDGELAAGGRVAVLPEAEAFAAWCQGEHLGRDARAGAAADDGDVAGDLVRQTLQTIGHAPALGQAFLEGIGELAHMSSGPP